MGRGIMTDASPLSWYLALKQGASKLPNVALVDQLGPVFSKVVSTAQQGQAHNTPCTLTHFYLLTRVSS